jgi:chromosome partitioning protein
MTYIIAVANQKGGVAKTSTVVSLGGALVQNGREVLLIDLDAQANLSLALGVDPSRVRHSVAEVLLNSGNLLSVSRETSLPGLDLVPANAEMELAERFMPVRKNYEFILREALNGSQSGANVRNAYEYILIDCPPSLGAVTLNALNAANLLIIPTQPEYFSAHALRNMITAIRRIRSQSNPQLNYRVLVTMHDRRNRIHRNLTERLRLAESLFETMIDTDTRPRKLDSRIADHPFSAQSRNALQYQALARELNQHAQEEINA